MERIIFILSYVFFSRNSLSLLPPLSILLQIPVQTDLVDGSRDRAAQEILGIRLGFTKSLHGRSDTKRCAEHILKLIAEVVIGGLKGIALLLYSAADISGSIAAEMI